MLSTLDIDIYDKIRHVSLVEERVDMLTKHSWKIRHSFPHKALEYALKARALATEKNYKTGIAYSYRCSGSAYVRISHLQIALSDLQHAFVMFYELNNKHAIATTLRVIGNVYKSLNQIEKALEHYHHALHFAQEVNDLSGIAYTYAHIGEAKLFLHNYTAALEFTEKAIAMQMLAKDEFGLANSYHNLAMFYFDTGDDDQALLHLHRAIEKANKINHLRGIAKSNNLLGNIHTRQGNFKEALHVFQTAMSASFEIGDKLLTAENYKSISYCYQVSGNYKLALETYTKYDEVKTTIQKRNDEITVKTLQAKFELEQSEKEKEIYKFKNIELEGAYKLIALKNKDITDSIRYAKHIQEAILPERQYLKNYLHDFFILYRPKDIVSGDFYWFYEKDGLLYFAVVDCTGHGVPGAFISIVGANIFNHVVRQNNFTDPAHILNEVNRLFNLSIRQTFEDSVVKDGMDLAFCVVDIPGLTLKFSGANNPLYLLRNGVVEIFKGNKFPIGIFIGDEVKKFSSVTVPLQKDDVVFMFTDGYTDQFGGNHNKKLMHHRFRKLLQDNHHLLLRDQHYALEVFLEQWQGNAEQVDDILVAAFKI